MITQEAPLLIGTECAYYQRAAGDISALDRVVNKILSFESLPDGWHFGRGAKIVGAASVSAQSIARHAILNGYDAEVFPGPDRDILIALRRGAIYYEIIADATGTISYYCEENGHEGRDLKNQSIDSVLEEIGKNKPFVWFITASSIPITGTRLSNVS